MEEGTIPLKVVEGIFTGKESTAEEKKGFFEKLIGTTSEKKEN